MLNTTESHPTSFMQVLWKLGGFPAASLAGDNQESAVFDGLNQAGFVLKDGQLYGLVLL